MLFRYAQLRTTLPSGSRRTAPTLSRLHLGLELSLYDSQIRLMDNLFDIFDELFLIVAQLRKLNSIILYKQTTDI